MEIVSVIIPTYNRVQELDRALKSVIEQTYKHLEIIVVDDNKDLEISRKINLIIENFNDNRIKLIKPLQHVNGAYARNIGIKASRGNYIAFLDDDDEWMKDKIDIQYNFLKKNSEYKGVSCNYGFYEYNQLVKKVVQPFIDNMHLEILRRNISLCTPTLLFDKKALLESGLFNENLKRHQDIQLLLDFTIKNKLYICSDSLVKINVDDKSNKPTNNDIEQIKDDFFHAIDSHIKIYSHKMIKRIKSAHYFEIIYVMFKNKRYMKAVKYFIKIGFSLSSYKDLYARFKTRKSSI